MRPFSSLSKQISASKRRRSAGAVSYQNKRSGICAKIRDDSCEHTPDCEWEPEFNRCFYPPTTQSITEDGKLVFKTSALVDATAKIGQLRSQLESLEHVDNQPALGVAQKLVLQLEEHIDDVADDMVRSELLSRTRLTQHQQQAGFEKAHHRDEIEALQSRCGTDIVTSRKQTASFAVRESSSRKPSTSKRHRSAGAVSYQNKRSGICAKIRDDSCEHTPDCGWEPDSNRCFYPPTTKSITADGKLVPKTSALVNATVKIRQLRSQLESLEHVDNQPALGVAQKLALQLEEHIDDVADDMVRSELLSRTRLTQHQQQTAFEEARRRDEIEALQSRCGPGIDTDPKQDASDHGYRLRNIIEFETVEMNILEHNQDIPMFLRGRVRKLHAFLEHMTTMLLRTTGKSFDYYNRLVEEVQDEIRAFTAVRINQSSAIVLTKPASMHGSIGAVYGLTHAADDPRCKYISKSDAGGDEIGTFGPFNSAHRYTTNAEFMRQLNFSEILHRTSLGYSAVVITYGTPGGGKSRILMDDSDTDPGLVATALRYAIREPLNYYVINSVETNGHSGIPKMSARLTQAIKARAAATMYNQSGTGDAVCVELVFKNGSQLIFVDLPGKQPPFGVGASIAVDCVINEFERLILDRVHLTNTGALSSSNLIARSVEHVLLHEPSSLHVIGVISESMPINEKLVTSDEHGRRRTAGEQQDVIKRAADEACPKVDAALEFLESIQQPQGCLMIDKTVQKQRTRC